MGELIALLRLALGPRPSGGLLIAKQFYRQLAGHAEFAREPERELAKRLGRRRIALLRCAVTKGGAP
jgi:hypothetical protein